jgi:hypothetical protein
MRTELNQAFTNIEKGFNIVESVPVVAGWSSALRAVIGAIQAIAGAILGLVGLIGKAASGDQTWTKLSHEGLAQMGHGAANFLRGVGAFFVATTFFGSLALGALQLWGRDDNKHGNGFRPIIPYKNDVEPAAGKLKAFA